MEFLQKWTKVTKVLVLRNSAAFCHFCHFTRQYTGLSGHNYTFIPGIPGINAKAGRLKVVILSKSDGIKNDPILSRLGHPESTLVQTRAQGGIWAHFLPLYSPSGRNNSGITQELDVSSRASMAESW